MFQDAQPTIANIHSRFGGHSNTKLVVVVECRVHDYAASPAALSVLGKRKGLTGLTHDAIGIRETQISKTSTDGVRDINE